MDGIEPVGIALMANLAPPVSAPLREAVDAREEIRDTSSASSPPEHVDEQKKQLARDFESVLLTKLFDQVRESIGGWGFEEEDAASKQVQGLFWFYLARDVADKGGFGLWKDIYQSFQRMDGVNTGDIIDEGL